MSAMLLLRALFVFVLFFLPTTTVVRGELPHAPEMLPERTVVLLRVRDVPDSLEKFKQTSFGRMLQDEQIGPLVSKLYASAGEAYKQIEEQVGVPLDRLLAIPQGEAWFAVVPSNTGGTPALAILIDAGDQLPTVLQLLEKGQKLLEENGGKKTLETFQDVRLSVFIPAGVEEPKLETRKTEEGQEVEITVVGPGAVVQFEKNGALVLSTSLELAQELLTNWNGKNEKSLLGNERFAAVMSRCSTGQDKPEFEWFVDPLALAKNALRGNIGAQTALTILPAIGLDGIQAVGGTVTYQTGEFDEIHHMHLLLENPRNGVLDLLALTSGDNTPENWVPADVVSYASFQWDLPKTYAGGTKLYDSFFGEGKAKEELTRRAKESLDVDFESELLASLQGRFTLCTWVEPPARFNSQCNLVGIKLTDAKAFVPILERIVTKGGERVEKKTFGVHTIYQFVPRNPRELPPEFGENLRRPQPCGAVVGDNLLVSDSLQCLEHAITTISSGKNLADELDFKLIQGKLTRLAGPQQLGAIVFARPEEAMKNLYNMASGKAAQDQLAKQAEENEFFRRLQEALQEHPLPPFSVIAKYFAPSGGMLTQDETGFHYQTFQLKRK
jgi:hypothetical protein